MSTKSRRNRKVPLPVQPKLTDGEIERQISSFIQERTRIGENVCFIVDAQNHLKAHFPQHVQQLSVPIRNIDPLYKWKEQLHSVQTYIMCFCAWRKLATLYDLERHLLEEFKVDCLWKLGIGNLATYPNIRNQFRMAPDMQTYPKITSEMIVKDLAEYRFALRAKAKGHLVNPDEFLLHVAKTHKLESAEQIGCVITSIPYLCKYVSKQTMQKEMSTIRSTMGNSMQSQLAKLYNDKNSQEYRKLAVEQEKKLVKRLEKQLKTNTKKMNLSGKVCYCSFHGSSNQKKLRTAMKKLIKPQEALSLKSLVELELQVINELSVDVGKINKILDSSTWFCSFLSTLNSMSEELGIHLASPTGGQALPAPSSVHTQVDVKEIETRVAKFVYSQVFARKSLSEFFSQLLQLEHQLCFEYKATSMEALCGHSMIELALGKKKILSLLELFHSDYDMLFNSLAHSAKQLPWDVSNVLMLNDEVINLLRDQAKEISPISSVIFHESDLINASELLESKANVNLIDLFRSVPFYQEIGDYLCWSEFYQADHGNLLRNIISAASNLNGKFLVLGGGSMIYKFPTTPEKLNEDEDEREVAMKMVGYLIHYGHDKDLLAQELRTQMHEITKDFNFNQINVYWSKVFSYVPSVMTCSILIQSIIPKDQWGSVFLHWPIEKQTRKKHLQELLKINVTTQDSLQMPSPSVAYSITVSQQDQTPSIFEDIVEHDSEDEEEDTEEEIEDDDRTDQFSTNVNAISTPVKVDEPKENVQEIVTEIVQNEFPPITAFTKPLYNNLEQAIKRLAEELYSEDVHFVLELIQNADDNEYDSGINPTIQFRINGDAITCINNEKGFKKENILALCRVGQSTKDKARTGYIGHKGIGFKSVFRVTNAPEVHSNDYHISFDIQQHGSMGYIKPTWLLKYPEFLRQYDNQTVVHLPLRKDYEQERIMNQIDSLRKTDSSLLLFLNRIKILRIEEVSANKLIEFERKDEGKKKIITKRINGILDQEFGWFSVTKQFKLDYSGEFSSITLAFPLQHTNHGWMLSDHLQDLPLFAYLPLKYSERLKFIVQGDFNVNSSREGVDQDDKRNHWIRKLVPEVFEEALQKIKSRWTPWHIAINRFLPFFPISCSKFFIKLPEDIAERLKHVEWMVDIDTDSASPSELCLFNKILSAYIPNELLHKAVGKRWIHPDIKLTKQLSNLLMINELPLENILKILQHRGSSNFPATKENIQWVAKMLMFILEAGVEKSTQIRALEVIPVKYQNKTHFIALRDEPDPVFFLWPDLIKSKELDKFLDRTKIISPELYFHLDEREQRYFFKLFEKMRVKLIRSRSEFVESCSVMFYRSLDAKTPDFIKNDESLSEQIQNYFNLIVESYLDLSEATILNLKEILWVPIMNNSPLPIRGNQIHLKSQLSDKLEWNCVNLTQEQLAPAQENVLQSLGILVGPHLSPDQQISPEFQQMLDSLSERNLCDMIMSLFTSSGSTYYLNQLWKDPASRVECSPWGKWLQQESWMYCTRHKTTHKANEFFLETLLKKSHSCVRDEFCSINFKCPDIIANYVNIRKEILPIHILQVLTRMKTQKLTNQDLQKHFIAAYEEIFRIYDKKKDITVRQYIQDNRLLLVIEDQVPKYYSPTETCMKDETEMILKFGEAVMVFYYSGNPSALRFFDKVAGVPEFPLVYRYCEIFRKQAENSSFPDSSVRTFAKRLIKHFFNLLADGYKYDQNQVDFIRNSVFWNYSLIPIIGERKWTRLTDAHLPLYHQLNTRWPNSIVEFMSQHVDILDSLDGETIDAFKSKIYNKIVLLDDQFTLSHHPRDFRFCLKLASLINIQIIPIITNYLEVNDPRLNETRLKRFHSLIDEKLVCNECDSISTRITPLNGGEEFEMESSDCLIDQNQLYVVSPSFGANEMPLIRNVLQAFEHELFKKCQHRFFDWYSKQSSFLCKTKVPTLDLTDYSVAEVYVPDIEIPTKIQSSGTKTSFVPDNSTPDLPDKVEILPPIDPIKSTKPPEQKSSLRTSSTELEVEKVGKEPESTTNDQTEKPNGQSQSTTSKQTKKQEPATPKRIPDVEVSSESNKSPSKPESEITPLRFMPQDIEIPANHELVVTQLSLEKFGLQEAHHQSNQTDEAYRAEKLVFLFLKSQNLPFKVEWLNGDGEKGKPYDLIIHSNPIQYIEVKSSTEVYCPGKRFLVPISLNELKFAQKHKQSYSLYRVFAPSTPKPNLIQIDQLVQKIEDALFTLCLSSNN